MYVLFQFGNTGLPIYNTEYDISPVPAQLQFVQTTSGVFDGDGQARSQQAFPFQLSYKAVVSEDTYANNQGALDSLREVVGTRARLYRGSDSYPAVEHYCVARLVSMPQTRPYSQRGYFEITLNFEQLSPWYGDPSGGWVFDSGEVFDDGRYFDEQAPSSLVTAVTLITVNNGGNLPVTNAVIYTIAGSEALESLTVWNLTTNCRFYWSGTLASNTTLQIDTGACSVLNAGVDDYNNFHIDDPFHRNEHWMELARGDNRVAVVRFGGGADSTIAFNFRDVWA